MRYLHIRYFQFEAQMSTALSQKNVKKLPWLNAFIWCSIAEFSAVAIMTMMKSESIIQGMLGLFQEPWSLLACLDLLMGLIFFSILIFHIEESKKRAWLWALALFTLGNPASGVYLVFNLHKIKRVLRSQEGVVEA